MCLVSPALAGDSLLLCHLWLCPSSKCHCPVKSSRLSTVSSPGGDHALPLPIGTEGNSFPLMLPPRVPSLNQPTPCRLSFQ